MNELCGERWLETGSPFLNTSDNTTQAAELASDLSCELCGSSCNERDELIKCEREINRLQGQKMINEWQAIDTLSQKNWLNDGNVYEETEVIF